QPSAGRAPQRSSSACYFGAEATGWARLLLACIAVVLLVAAPAHAGPTVDWARGLVIAPGAAAADLRAPSADIARLKARRIAMERARTLLAKQARSLPWAGGGDVGGQLRTRAQEHRFDRVIARSLARDVDYSSDGS